MRRLSLLGLVAIIAACNQQPKVLEVEDEQVKAIFNEKEAPESSNSEHHVRLLDTLQSSRYSYLKVSENDKEFWLATMRANFIIGEDYVFEKGLFKTDYYSTQFDRSFDEIYLVSDLRPAFSDGQKNALDKMFDSKPARSAPSISSEEDLEREGSLKIAELIQNAEQYVGKSVQITAKVTKINANIMDRHWLHLKDGSFDNFDLVATSQTAVPAGHIVTIKATLNRDVDFGAGYSYDLILENAEVIP